MLAASGWVNIHNWWCNWYPSGNNIKVTLSKIKQHLVLRKWHVWMWSRLRGAGRKVLSPILLFIRAQRRRGHSALLKQRLNLPADDFGALQFTDWQQLLRLNQDRSVVPYKTASSTSLPLHFKSVRRRRRCLLLNCRHPTSIQTVSPFNQILYLLKMFLDRSQMKAPNCMCPVRRQSLESLELFQLEYNSYNS